MKILIALVVASLCLLCHLPAQGQQLSKAELKELKQEIKKYKKNPLLYKLKIQKLEKLATTRRAEVDRLEGVVRDKDRSIMTMNDSMQEMRDAMQSLYQEVESMKTPETVEVQEDDPDLEMASVEAAGSGFKVQVGTFEKFDITEYFNSPKLFDVIQEDGRWTYSIGNFRNREEAQRFAEHVKQMGISDAFVKKFSAPE